jgi:hypothetical protein
VVVGTRLQDAGEVFKPLVEQTGKMGTEMNERIKICNSITKALQ